jgi:uncharacterized protein YqjF (DUF2071 family)
MPIPFLTAQWRSLAMLNYRVEPAVLSPFLPPGLELDFFEDATYVSLVGFLFLDTRLMGAPIPFHRNFEEVNLRFYVKRRAGAEERRGVVFIKEIVPRAAIAWTARTFYNERYTAMPMRHRCDPGRVSYSWKAAERWHSLQVGFEGDPGFAPEGSQQQFITEHYWGYSLQRRGGCFEYRVDHPKWKLWNATDCNTDIDFSQVYGERFAAVFEAPPSSAFVAEGSPVTVGWPRRIPSPARSARASELH